MHTNSRRYTAHVGWTPVALLFLLACAAGCSKAPAGGSTRLLTTISDVRALPVDLATQGSPVRVRGVVTYADHEWGLSPFHYVPEYYAEIWRQLEALGVGRRAAA